MMKPYRVTLLTKKGGEKHWVIDVEEQNAKRARWLAKVRWLKEHPDLHPFQIEAKPIPDGEEFLYHWFCDVEKQKKLWNIYQEHFA